MYRSSENFYNKPVVTITGKTEPIDLSPISPAIRVEFEGEYDFAHHIDHLKQHQDLSKMDALVIGTWSIEPDLSDSTELKEALDVLVAEQSHMPALKALFMGDISYEESEISWIDLVDFAPFLNQMPQLESFRARGGGDFLQSPIKHNNLKQLAFETGSMWNETLESLIASDIPNLEYLELWLGNDYELATDLKLLEALIDGTKFPKLRHLGLCNYSDTDTATITLANSPMLKQLDALDLSLGTLGDEGVKALLASDALSGLKKLDARHHFISDADLIEQLKAKIPDVDLSEPLFDKKHPDKSSRYNFITE